MKAPSGKRASAVSAIAVGIVLASSWTAQGAPLMTAAPPATYTLVQQVETQGRQVKLWRENGTGRLHGEITNAKWPDQIMLTGSGCPGEARDCYLTYVPPGARSVNTPAVSGVVDACGNAGAGWKCTCIVCLHADNDSGKEPSEVDTLARRESGL